MQNKLDNKTILVTGGAGYIGLHFVKATLKASQSVNIIVVDNLVYGHEDLIRNFPVKFIKGDIGDEGLMRRVFQENQVDFVVHFAAYAYVGESVKDPIKYYENNVISSIILLKTMKEAGVSNIIFSSSCATYGLPESMPINEDVQQSPINPYGQTKLAIEKAIKDFHTAYGLNYVILRYFNVAGADPENEIGEDHNPETHLIPLLLESIFDPEQQITVFGDDYPTEDGTCIRDYIHVNDLVHAHILGIGYLLEGKGSNIFNVGLSSGYSVKEVIDLGKKVTGKDVSYKIGKRREGDPPVLIASSEKIKRVLGWEPKFHLEDMLQHAWAWYQKRVDRKIL